jgi:hypothetical protein
LSRLGQNFRPRSGQQHQFNAIFGNPLTFEQVRAVKEGWKIPAVAIRAITRCWTGCIAGEDLPRRAACQQIKLQTGRLGDILK